MTTAASVVFHFPFPLPSPCISVKLCSHCHSPPVHQMPSNSDAQILLLTCVPSSDQPVSIYTIPFSKVSSCLLPLLSSLFSHNLNLYLPAPFSCPIPVNMWIFSYFCLDLIPLPVSYHLLFSFPCCLVHTPQ